MALSSAVLLRLRATAPLNAIDFYVSCFMVPVTFYVEETWKRTRLAGHVTRFKMAENTCTIFSH